MIDNYYRIYYIVLEDVMQYRSFGFDFLPDWKDNKGIGSDPWFDLKGAKFVLTQEEILALFLKGFNCTQIVFMTYAPLLGLSEEKALEMADEIGSGTFRGGVCGALEAAMQVLRLLYEEESDFSETEIANRINKLRSRFINANQGENCKDLLGMDLSQIETLDLNLLQERLTTRCPAYVFSAISLIEEDRATNT
ncbi:MAG: C-GCAxxG-C-C family protein [Eubacteriales bacterium]|nr:C-GCAxxG-C-C family protein [Eubacteriales bacterium]MDD3349405.1 C-GCAxxG-C-C family protein [Eubacteriales bacterium]